MNERYDLARDMNNDAMGDDRDYAAPPPANDELRALAKKYNESVNVCYCRTVKSEGLEDCYNCVSLVKVLAQVAARARWDEHFNSCDFCWHNMTAKCERGAELQKAVTDGK